jgi:osmotically inducible lipoprotein OsmB
LRQFQDGGLSLSYPLLIFRHMPYHLNKVFIRRERTAEKQGRNSMLRKFHHVALIAAVAFGMSACSGMSSTQQRTLSGGAIGAGVGAAAGAVTGGCVSCGAVVGGAVGAGAGYVYDKTR